MRDAQSSKGRAGSVAARGDSECDGERERDERLGFRN